MIRVNAGDGQNFEGANESEVIAKLSAAQTNATKRTKELKKQIKELQAAVTELTTATVLRVHRLRDRSRASGKVVVLGVVSRLHHSRANRQRAG